MNIPQATSRVQRMPGLEGTGRSILGQASIAFSEAVGGQVPNGAIPEIWRSIVGVAAVGAFASPPVRVGELWLFQETVHQLSSAPWSRSPLEIARAAVEHGLSRMAELPQRFHTPNGLKHSTLIAYRDDDQQLSLSTWFDLYNARQTIEAGIKETNVVFKMHPLKMHSSGGIALQEQFSLFAANFVRWAAEWLRQRVARSTPRFDDALSRVKAMVRVAANTSAWLVEKDEGLLLKFDETGAYPGVELRLAGAWRVRPPLLPLKVQVFDFQDDFSYGCT